jgi:hypothetical protein
MTAGIVLMQQRHTMQNKACGTLGACKHNPALVCLQFESEQMISGTPCSPTPAHLHQLRRHGGQVHRPRAQREARHPAAVEVGQLKHWPVVTLLHQAEALHGDGGMNHIL